MSVLCLSINWWSLATTWSNYRYSQMTRNWNFPSGGPTASHARHLTATTGPIVALLSLSKVQSTTKWHSSKWPPNLIRSTPAISLSLHLRWFFKSPIISAFKIFWLFHRHAEHFTSCWHNDRCCIRHLSFRHMPKKSQAGLYFLSWKDILIIQVIYKTWTWAAATI
jgi:hypothetical protein